MGQDVRYLLFDVESVPDGELIAKTRYGSRNLNAEEAIGRFRQELLLKSGRDFIPYTFHIPVAVVVAKVRADFELLDIVSLDVPQHRSHVITQHFWAGWEMYEQPTWVTFNGRTFDLPLMEHAAYRYGISVPKWFNVADKSFEQKRNRYNLHSHIDLQEILTNFGATWFRGGLNLAATLVGKPGKMDVQGDMVYEMYRQNRLSEINEYCRCDVLDTYFVFLRTMLMMGRLTIDEEKQRVASVKEMLESESADHPAYQQYLEQWGDWENPWPPGEDDLESESAS
ncbi:MAG: ribonuclease H-like domain-containing protein [Planctomycetota bacterium]|nr:ribonuclease H-like domain-containing protein [Planctomycetota bacterium]